MAKCLMSCSGIYLKTSLHGFINKSLNEGKQTLKQSWIRQTVLIFGGVLLSKHLALV